MFQQSANQYLTRQQIESLVAAIPDHVKPLRAEDIMTKTLVTMSAEMTVGEALRLITVHPFNAFPLIDGDGKSHGVINQNQIYDALKTSAFTLVLERKSPRKASKFAGRAELFKR